jgi:hypothetical protein
VRLTRVTWLIPTGVDLCLISNNKDYIMGTAPSRLKWLALAFGLLGSLKATQIPAGKGRWSDRNF